MTSPWSCVNDGIVSGKLLHRTVACDVCGVPTCCVEVDGYVLEDIHYTSTIIALPDDKRRPRQFTAVYLGIGCGCYSKFHRQVAHIRDSIEEGREFPQT